LVSKKRLPTLEELQASGKALAVEELVQVLIADSKRQDKNALCLNFGCGQRPIENTVGVDFAEDLPEDVQLVDLFSTPWPWADDSVSFVFASHFIEHIPNWDTFFAELYRVMKPGGRCAFLTPHESSTRAWQDPDHKQAISAERYQYLSRRWRDGNRIDHYGASVNFEMEFNPIYNWHEDFADKADDAKAFALRHYRNAVLDIFAVLRKLP
jgi:SAM-dependent methyltransferase